MSALNRHAEFEEQLRGMRDRLVAVSEEVSRTVTKAKWHAETAPMHVRARVQATIAEITNSQEWLQTRLAQLPREAQARHAAMQEMLQVQFVTVQQVTAILDELLALRNKPTSPEYLPPDLRPPTAPEPASFASPFPAPSYAHQDPGTPIARDFAPALATPATAPLFDPPAARQPLFPLDVHPQPQPAPYQPQMTPFPQPQHHAEPHWGHPQGSGYALHPHPQPHQFQNPPGAVHLADLEPSLAPPMGPGEMPRAFTARQPEPKPAQRGARKYQRPVQRSRVGFVTVGLLVAIAVVGVGGWLLWSTVAGGSKAQRVSIGDPAARKTSNTGTGAAPVRSVDPAAARVPQAPPMSAPPFAETDDFVAVIATHREKDGLTNMFMDLRKQYPGIVATRKAIAQTVNLGSDGVWYQLVLLPPGPRAQAEAVCEELRRAGYPRCAVRPNKP